MPEKKYRRYIGIDFGTSTTVMCYNDYVWESDTWVAKMPQPQMITHMGSSIIPTLIVEKDESLGIMENYFGKQAEDLALNFPEQLHSEFKMDLFDHANPEKQKEAMDLTNKFFAFLKHLYDQNSNLSQQALQEYEIYTRVSYPVRSIYADQDYVIKAAENAKFENIQKKNEPSAALQYFLTNMTPETSMIFDRYGEGSKINILLLDMGAGTTDMILYEYTCDESTETLQEKSCWPKLGMRNTFGGREIDKLLLDYLKRNKLIAAELDNAAIEKTVLLECKKWKESGISTCLQNETGTVNNMGQLAQFSFGAKNRYTAMSQYHITRHTLGIILGNYMPVFTNALKQIVAEGELSEEDIDLIVITGGHSKWFFVKEIILGKEIPGYNNDMKFGFTKILKEPSRILTTINPNEIVAMGLVKGEEKLKWRNISKHDIYFTVKIGDSEEKTIRVLKKKSILPGKATFTDTFTFVQNDSKPIYYSLKPYVIEDEQKIYFKEIWGKIEPTLFTKFLNKVLGIFGDVSTNYDLKSKLTLNFIFDEDENISFTGQINSGNDSFNNKSLDLQIKK